jgi:hypothetical protein
MFNSVMDLDSYLIEKRYVSATKRKKSVGDRWNDVGDAFLALEIVEGDRVAMRYTERSKSLVPCHSQSQTGR